MSEPKSGKEDHLIISIERRFPGDTEGFPTFFGSLTWKNSTAGNDAIQAFLGKGIGEAFAQMQDAKNAAKA